jgi:hypothetical protein
MANGERRRRSGKRSADPTSQPPWSLCWVIAAARPNLQCGDKLWIVEVVAPFGGTDEMLKDLKAKVFKDREVKFRAVEGGRGVARVM